jgi:predicted RNA binding protein YcfA (HicA-like mRNA interferase family)
VKLPRNLSGAEVIKALKRLGFEVVRQKGSHVRLCQLSKKVTVPLHKELRPKTLESILNQAQISIEELMEKI